VKRNKVVGDKNNEKGVVMDEIVKENINVRNGVVNIINRKIMVVEIKVNNLIEDREDGNMKKLYYKIRDEGGEFMNIIKKKKDLKLFDK
jgi:hypothetical protein